MAATRKRIHQSVADLHEFLSTTEPTGTSRSSVADGRSQAWDLGLGFDGAMAGLVNGWSEHRDMVNGVASQVKADALKVTDAMRPTFVFDVSGGAVDVGRLMSGERECMIDFRMAPSSARERVITVIVGCAVSAKVPAETIVKRGAVLVALIDVLTATGRSVEVWAEATSKNVGPNKDTYITGVKLKDASEALDLDCLLFGIAHPAMLRRAIFADWERSETGSHLQQGPSYGIPSSKIHLADELGATITMASAPGGYFPELGDPASWIATQLERIAAQERVETRP